MRIALTIFLLLSFADAFAVVSPALPQQTEESPPCFEEPCAPPEALLKCDPGPLSCSSSTSDPFKCNVHKGKGLETVYQCLNNACGKNGGAIKQATESFTCETTTESCDDGCGGGGSSSITSIIGGPFYNDEGEFSRAGKYQICPASGNSWSQSPPAYQCSGQCYPAPEIKPLNDNSLSPKNVFDDEKKPKLPVNFGWKDNVEQELAANPNPDGSVCSVETYKYEVPAALLPTTDTVPAAKHDIVVDEDECKLASQTSYNFQVQACANGPCGATGTLPFTTSPAPQLLSPYDPDWEGKENAATHFPAEFNWCEYPDSSVKSYTLNAYEVKADGTQGTKVLLTGTSSREKTTYSDSSLRGGVNRLGRGASYFWEIGACTDSQAKQCGILSQLWKVVPGGELKAPINLSPSSGSFVNMTDALQWQHRVFATHYVVHIKGPLKDAKGSVLQEKDFFIQNNQLPLGSIWQGLALTTPYQWKVAPCGGAPTSKDIEDCKNKKDIDDEGIIPWSSEQQFTTTGAQPKSLNVFSLQEGVAGIPLTLGWNDADGAASYQIVVAPNARIVSEKSETTLQYPALKTKTPYSWAVKTCADKLANVCGPEASGSFTTVTLAAPPLSVPAPGQKEFEPSTRISWGTVFSGNFYSYTLTFLSPGPEEASTECKKTYEAAHQIIAENGATVRFRCLGNYTLAVQACIDSDCKEAGASTISALSVEKLLAPSGGLVPCDRGNDAPGGADERKPCGIEHIFLLIRNLIDFALWKLSLIIVVLMAIATGAIIFFSFGGPDVMTKVRAMWKAVGIGVLILLFSWLFLNILLGLVGFNIKFYGHWYEVPFK
ncbi:MAG: hypothetical protein Greene071421_380 [Parcubacteria group bacterium Greene0714_21]|nr:MAG: hypothetical protein Greene041639_33 [Parcubacteria group bacterium Greene0416_39]TSC98363.1 MAG: hypothetical protein Greene101447_106 [Parcubacteria group bacterium Greene1014_47]TSD04014.1 MAG: hypothetical protein Greene071421_380 [Parcubacteria group bacterium Greene0714_21]